MNDAAGLGLAFAGGLVLGAIFFGGLWWTVRKALYSRQPALWFVGSQLLRTSIALAGFYGIARGQWQSLMLCLLGFVTARLIVTRLTQFAQAGVPMPQEARHAPEPR